MHIWNKLLSAASKHNVQIYPESMVMDDNVDLHLLIDSLPQPLCVISSLDMKILYSNKSFGQNIRQNPDDIIDFFEDLISNEYDRKHLSIQLLSLSVDNPHSTILSVAINVNDGKRRIFNLQANCFSESKVALQFQSTVTKTTSEIDCATNATSLNDPEVAVDFIVNAPKPMHAIDNTGTILWANKLMLNGLGYSYGEYVGHKISEFYAAKKIEEFNRNTQAIIKNGLINERETLLLQKDGTVRHFIVNATIRHFGDGTWYTRSILRDDTERLIRSQAELAAREHQVTRSILDLKRTFVRYVSHETRSPLGVVHGGLELLMADKYILSGPPQLQELIQDVYTSSNNAIYVLSDLLQYENIDAGTFSLDRSRQMLGTWTMADNLRALKAFAKGRQISFSVSHNFDQSISIEPTASSASSSSSAASSEAVMMPFSLMVLDIDRIRIEQVVRNLVSNAVKFTKQDGHIKVVFSAIPLTLRTNEPVTTTIAGDFSNAIARLRVEIADSGAGIDAENQKKLFSQFAQFSRNELQGGGGSGLGLWISRHIIEMHKGSIGFHSDGVGLGTTFFFELPLFAASEAELSSMPPQGPTTCAFFDSFTHSSNELHLQLPIKTFGQEASTGCMSSSSTLSPRSAHEEGCNCSQDVSPEIGAMDALKDAMMLLVVDDSSMNRKMTRRLLESSGDLANCRIVEADDGTTAIAAMEAAAKPFDCVFLDSVMVDMHGPEAARKMRGELKYRGPIISVTGNSLPEDINFLLQCGVDIVLTKPTSKAKLFEAMRKLKVL